MHKREIISSGTVPSGNTADYPSQMNREFPEAS